MNTTTLSPQPKEEKTMILRYHFLLAVMLSLIAAPAIASAANFTFTVPVEVSHLPTTYHPGWSERDYNRAVSCNVFSDLRPTVARGGGSSRFNTIDGAFRGTVTVSVDTYPGIDPASITHYKCWLSFYVDLRGEMHEVVYSSGSATFPVAPGAPFTPMVAAPIR